MTDPLTTEDIEMIRRYRASVPQPRIEYRVRLRHDLLATGPHMGVTEPRARRRRVLPVGLVAALFLASTLVASLWPSGAAPLTAEAVLARAVALSRHQTPYTSTSVTTYTTSPDPSAAPDVINGVLGRHEIVTRLAFRDDHHWRVDIRVARPALQSERQVIVANGHSVVWYRGLENRATTTTMHSQLTAKRILSAFQSMQYGEGLPWAFPLQRYLTLLNNPAAHTHARIVGQVNYLGRPTELVEVWPASTETTSHCNSRGRCRETTHGYGRARFWIDRVTGIELRYREWSLPVNSGTGDFTFRTTALHVGVGPSRKDLAYAPPVTPRPAGSDLGSRVGGGAFGAGPTPYPWPVPAGFVDLAMPRDAHGHRYDFVGGDQFTQPAYNIDFMDELFRRPVTANQTVSRNSRGAFVYIEEERRTSGLPAQLTLGTRANVGVCAAYTGRYAQGLKWIALSRGTVSVLAVTNRLGTRGLLRWVAASGCR